MISGRRSLVKASAALWVTSQFPFAQGAAYPVRPVKVVVPTSAGGVVDVEARRTTPHLAKALGQPVIIDNRPGASQTIGAALVAKSPPDGYTLLRGGSSSLATAPSIMPHLSYDPVGDFTPIVQVVRSSPILLVNPTLGVRTLQQLIGLAKKRPGQLNFGSNGSAGSLHVLGQLLKVVTGTDITHIPYKGTAPMLAAVLSNEAQLAFDFAMTSIGHIRAGALLPIVVTGPKRIPVLSSTPTAAEAGFAQLSATTSGGYLAPSGTDSNIIARLNRELAAIIRAPEFSRWLVSVGIEPIGGSPEAYKSVIAEELAQWGRMIKLTGVSAAE